MIHLIVVAAKRKLRTRSELYDRNIQTDRGNFFGPSTSQNVVSIPQYDSDADSDTDSNPSPFHRSNLNSKVARTNKYGSTKLTSNNSRSNYGNF